jgi:hypothetical protein
LQRLPHLLADEAARRGVGPHALVRPGSPWRLALEKAGKVDGYLLTTDADSRVAPDWIVRQHVAFARGADAVAGIVYDDPAKFRRLPARLRRRGRLEARYSWLLTEIEARLNPDPDDPWRATQWRPAPRWVFAFPGIGEWAGYRCWLAVKTASWCPASRRPVHV